MAKKLTPNQLKVLRDLAERYHNNDLQSRVLPVDKRTARGMTTLERPYIKPSFPIAKTYYYFITEAGLKHLAALDAQPAAGNAGSGFDDVLDDTIYSIAPIAQYEVELNTPVSPVLNNALNVLTGEKRQWVEVKPEQRIAEVFSLLDDAGVRDGNLMSITDRVKALIQEVEHLRAALTPFAAMGEFYKERAMEYARPESVWYALNHIKVTYADLFAAYEALAETVGE